MFNIHAIEKGLSHSNFRFDFGHRALTNISEFMNKWETNGFPNNDEVILMALSVLKAYKEKHLELLGSVPPFFEGLFANRKKEID